MKVEDHTEENPTIMEPNDTANDAKMAFLVTFGPFLACPGPGWCKSI